MQFTVRVWLPPPHTPSPLSDETTRMLHGEESLVRVKESVGSVFGGGAGSSGSSSAALPQVVVTRQQLEGEGGSAAAAAGAGAASSVRVVDLFVALKLCKSKAEVRRLIKGRGARIDGEQIMDEKMQLELGHFGEGTEVRLAAGKKRHGVVVLG